MNFEKYVPNVHFEQIPIKNLVSNHEQRIILIYIRSILSRSADATASIM